MHRLEKVLKKLDVYLRVFEDVSVVVFLSLCSLITFAEVISRYFFSASIHWSSEIAVVCIIWTVFLGISRTLRKGSHLKLEVLVDLLSRPWKAFAVLVGSIIGIVFGLIFFFQSIRYTVFLVQSGESSVVTNIPEYVYFLAVPAGGFLFFLRYVHAVFRMFRRRDR